MTWTTIINMAISFVLSGVIGWEREKDHKPAGLRTHIMVGLGATLAALIGVYLAKDHPNIDPARIAAQVVSGIGFIGVGIIWKHGADTKGLTTSASILVVAIIGLATGFSFYAGAVVATALTYITLIWGRLFKHILKPAQRSDEENASPEVNEKKDQDGQSFPL